jgi:hypothetical protein
VEKAFSSSSSCASDIQSKGNYDQVFGFDYDWTQDINQSGSQLAGFLDDLAAACPSTHFDIEAHSEGVPVSLSAATQASTQTQGLIDYFVSLGGPILGTTVADTAQGADSGLLNLQNGIPIVGGYLQTTLFGGWTTGLASSNSELALTRQNFAANLPNVKVYEVAGDNSPLPGVANSLLFSNTPNDGIIPLSSALPQGSGLPNETQLPVFDLSHTQLECDPNAQNSIGATLALQLSPTSLSFIVPSDGTNPPDQTIQLNNQKAISWVAAVTPPAPSWLAISPMSGTTPGTIDVSVDVASLSTLPASASINITASYSSGASVPISVPVTVTGTSSTYSGSFSGTVADDEYGPCPGASATIDGGGTITVTPVGSGISSLTGQVILNQDTGLCNNYSGTYPVTGGIDPTGTVNFVYFTGTQPGDLQIGFTGTVGKDMISGTWLLIGGLDSQGYSADYLSSTFSMALSSAAVKGRNVDSIH